jgi:zona occludens toxin (predicted ATPase)
MIIIYDGKPGSGKSYDAVRKILSNLKIRRRVVTNIDGLDKPDCQEMIKYYCDMDDAEIQDFLLHLTKDDVFHFWDFVQVGDLIVIDEAQKFFNSRDWQKSNNRAFGDWASEHRHNGNDLIIVTQKRTRIDSAVRDLADFTYSYLKINMFGKLITQKYRRFVYQGDDTEPLTKPKTFNYDPFIFKCYQSFFSGEVTEFNDPDKSPNVLNHPIFWSIPVLIVLFVFFFSRSSIATGDLFGSKKAEQAIKEKNIDIKNSSPSLPTELLPGVEKEKNFIVIGFIDNKEIRKTYTGEIIVE